MINIFKADKLYIKQSSIRNIDMVYAMFTHKLKDGAIIKEFTIYQKQDLLGIPIGYLDKILPMVKQPKIKELQVDHPCDFEFNGSLRPEQHAILKEWYSEDSRSGILVAKAGFGKTVVASHLIATYCQKTIIVVPTLTILEQWKTSIETFLGYEPGIIGGGKADIKDITIVSARSLKKYPELTKEFGLIMVDECHTACAPQVRTAINSFFCKYRIGLTATPYRKDGTDFHLEGMFGPTVVSSDDKGIKAKIISINTGAKFNFCDTIDYIEALSILSKDEEFAEFVANRIDIDYFRGRKIVVLSPRIEHLDLIAEKLEVPCTRLVSATTKAEKKDNAKALAEEGRVVLLGTYQLVGTGFDAPFLDCLHLPYSYNNKGLFVQLAGRIERKLDGKPTPEFVEYMFDYEGFTKFQQNNRYDYYKELGYEVTHEDV